MSLRLLHLFVFLLAGVLRLLPRFMQRTVVLGLIEELRLNEEEKRRN